MVKNSIFASIVLSSSLFANDCSPYFNPNRFYEAPEQLGELIDERLNTLELFASSKSYEVLKFKKINDTYYNNFIKLGQYKYPKLNGIFSYKIKDNKIDEITLSTVNIYKYTEDQIANEINNDFEGYWADWNENAYEMQLKPEQTLFFYDNKYFSFSIYIYGVKGDTTKLKGTSINYWMKDYTKEVNEYIRCSSK